MIIITDTKTDSILELIAQLLLVSNLKRLVVMNILYDFPSRLIMEVEIVAILRLLTLICINAVLMDVLR